MTTLFSAFKEEISEEACLPLLRWVPPLFIFSRRLQSSVSQGTRPVPQVWNLFCKLVSLCPRSQVAHSVSIWTPLLGLYSHSITLPFQICLETQSLSFRDQTVRVFGRTGWLGSPAVSARCQPLFHYLRNIFQRRREATKESC